MEKDNLENLPNISIDKSEFQILITPSKFREQILEQIIKARNRIYISALYLENDDAGNQILEALYEAKKKNASIDIKVFIDFHRAQRGLVGKKKEKGNIDGYYKYSQKYNSKIEIYGIPVSSTEIFGVLHLKGFVFDDTVIYSGASLNNVYLNFYDKFRLDRYFVINSQKLANSFIGFMQTNFLNDNGAVTLFKNATKIKTETIKKSIKKFTQSLAMINYQYPSSKINSEDLSITPLFGFGKKENILNKTILNLLDSATEKVIIFTPYFNFPPKIKKKIIYLLKKKSIKINIIIGDKTANDFYISPNNDFKKIGLIPYIYEQNLKTFAKKYQSDIDEDILNIYLWKKANNTFHIKGLEIDNQYRLITGNNLNPRGWKLDMENAILINDKKKILTQQFEKEYQYIIKDCTKVTDYNSITSISDYPLRVKKFIKTLRRTRIDKLIKRIM